MSHRMNRMEMRQLSRFFKTAFPVGVAVLFAHLLFERLKTVDMAAVWQTFSDVSLFNWMLAGLATALSFWAVGRYDAIIHRHIGTSIGSKAAQHSGMAAIAVAQTLGFGVFTGAIARWRMLPDLSLWAATKVSAMVALTFCLGLGVVISIVSVVLGLPSALPGHSWFAVWIFPITCLGLVALGLFPKFSVLGKDIHLPPLRALLSITGLTALDTLAACAALWVLLPAGTDISFTALLPVFLLALGAGLLSGTPGGVGPFELVFLALLAGYDEPSLIAAIVAFRIIYYALPAVLGAAAVFLWPCDRSHATRVLLEPYRRHLDPLLNRSVSEHGILRQGTARLLSGPFPSIQTVHETGQALVAVGPAVSGPPGTALRSLKYAADTHNLVACFYKCPPRQAAIARQHGWRSLPIAEEAIVKPATFDLSAPSARYLRRKIRKAEKAGIQIKAASGILPFAQMAEVSAHWAERQGGERGFSMGQFTPDYVRHQRILLAYQADQLIGFVSFHVAQQDWSLDLIRFRPDAPDGTIYALIAQAIAAAEVEGIDRLSLAAAPLSPSGKGLIFKLRASFERLAGGRGLRNFKTAFAPTWERRYLCAPTWFDMTLASIDIVRAIHNPPSLVPPTASLGTNPNIPHEDYD